MMHSRWKCFLTFAAILKHYPSPSIFAQRQVIITVAAASDIPPIAGAHVIDVHDLRARMEHGEDA